MRIGRHMAGAGLILLATAAGVEAQAARSGTGRVIVSLNGGSQLTRSEFQRSFTYPLYVEEAEVDGRYSVPAAPLFEGGLGIRVFGPLTASVTVSYHRQQGAADLAARLPHPLLPSRPRPLDATVLDLQRSETAVHVQVGWLAPVGDRVAVVFFGGPTAFRVEQDAIRQLTLNETYPFDQVSLGSASEVRHQESRLGYHAGADVMYRVNDRVAVGGVARYSRASLNVPADGGPFRLTAGGLQMTGGLRLLF